MPPPTLPGENNKEEAEALKQFRQKIPDILLKLNEYKSHDAWLRRWIVAREFNVEKAEKMLRKSLEWRLCNGMDEIMEWKAPDLIVQQFPSKATGFDKDGCIVAAVPFGKWDIRKVISLGMKNEFLRYVDQTFEQSMKLLEYKSTPEKMLTQFVIILDFQDFSLRQLASRETIETIAEIIRRFEANNPETLKAAWVVNAPKMFEILFGLIKPLMTARTISKVRVFGGSIEQWRAALLENIEPDQLPSEYGGSNTSCKNYKVSDGFDVFPVYDTFNEEELIAVTVEAGSKHSVEFSLLKGSQLSWNFRTTDYNIGFSVLYNDDFDATKRNEEREPEQIFFCSRADSHLHLQKGSLVAELPGTYTLVFDNSYSRFRSKSLFVAARVKHTRENNN